MQGFGRFPQEDARPVETVDIPLFKAELEKQVGEYVAFELARTF